MAAETPTKITDEQILEARRAGVSNAELAAQLGVNPRTLSRRIAKLVRRLKIPPTAKAVPEFWQAVKVSSRLDAEGNVQGQSIQAIPEPADAEHQDIIPEGHVLKGISTLLDRDGQIAGQWVKTKEDQDRLAERQEATLKGLISQIEPLPTIDFRETALVQMNLANLHTLTDCHVGMQAWGRETGEPWDLAIAERILTQTFARLIECSPLADTCIINNLGDFEHYDSLTPVTPTSGHVLDADSRFQKMIETSTRILKKIIMMAAQRHRKVIVLMNEGNHDPSSSAWKRVLFSMLFEKTERITVENSPNPYVAIEWGKTMLGFHHGHLAKFESLPMVFAAQFSEIWGRTKYRYCHTGHLHSHKIEEKPGMEIEQHPTLAARDAYASRYGYLSMRRAISKTYCKNEGEIGSITQLPVEIT